MGSPYYWRPLGRQLYFSLLGDVMVERPWIPAAIHAALFVALALVLYRIGRRRFAPPIAACLASFPLLGEPARFLLGWPSGVENLLALVSVALAVHETLAGRLLTAGLAALAGVLSHEAASLVLPLLPALAWWRTRRLPEALPWAGVVLAVGGVEAIGHAIARTHGMGMPSDAVTQVPWSTWPVIVSQALAAQLNLEDAGDRTRLVFGSGYAVLFAMGLVLALRRGARGRLRQAGPALVAGLVWFAAGLLPLLWVWPDWNGWRTTMPGLGLAVAVTGLLGLAWAPLAAAFVALRLAALLVAPAAPATVATVAPASVSQFSFPRLARLQRTVESTRRALRVGAPRLPRGATVRYWGLPQLTEFGFETALAARVWYGDSTLAWGALGGASGVRADAVIEFVRDQPWPARVVEPHAMRLLADALEARQSGRAATAESLMARAMEAQPGPGGPFRASVLQNRSRLAHDRGDRARADSLNRICLDINPDYADAWALEAILALERGDRATAIAAVRRCLALEPRHDEGLRIAEALGGR